MKLKDNAVIYLLIYFTVINKMQYFTKVYLKLSTDLRSDRQLSR